MAGRKANQSSEVYELLRNDILRLAIRPGEDIDETALAERYGTSRTPVREALIRLEADELVQFRERRGARVTALILSDLPRFMEALDLNRRATCRLAAVRRWDEEIGSIRKAYDDFVRVGRSGNVGTDNLSGQVADHEMKFYLQIAAAGHNSYITDAFSRLLTAGLRMMRLPFAYSPRYGQSVQGYLESLFTTFGQLVEHIVERNELAAEACAGELHSILVRRLREYNEENLLSSVSAAASEPNVTVLRSKQK
jgi:DNA-binding GntR family transcriptional regulator